MNYKTAYLELARQRGYWPAHYAVAITSDGAMFTALTVHSACTIALEWANDRDGVFLTQVTDNTHPLAIAGDRIELARFESCRAASTGRFLGSIKAND